MVRRQSFINKIRELGYSFKSERKRVFLWRKGMHFISVPKAEMLDDVFVISSLRQAGITDGEIEAFLKSAKC
jgi:hypothetical protein